MRSSQEIASLATAMSAAMADVENASKDRKAHSYWYADLAQVLDIARPLLAKHQLAIVQAPSTCEMGISVTTRLMHSSGEWLEETLTMPVEAGRGMSQAQAAGSVITYARRYALAAMLGIAQEDTDAQRPAAPAPKAKPAQVDHGRVAAIQAALEAAQLTAEQLCASYQLGSLAEFSEDQAKHAIARLNARAEKLAKRTTAAKVAAE